MHDDVKYSVTIRGKDFGPFGVKRLQEFVNRGQIEPDTILVSTRGDRIQASAVPLLRFEARANPAAPDPGLIQRFGSTEPKPFLSPATEGLSPRTPPQSLAEEPTRILQQPEPESSPGAPPPGRADEPTQLLPLGDPTEPGVTLPSRAEEPTQLLPLGDPTEPGVTLPSRAEEPTQLLWLDDRTEPGVTPSMLPPDAQAAEQQTPTDSGTKSCPYCDETIQAAAIKCRYCAEWL